MIVPHGKIFLQSIDCCWTAPEMALEPRLPPLPQVSESLFPCFPFSLIVGQFSCNMKHSRLFLMLGNRFDVVRPLQLLCSTCCVAGHHELGPQIDTIDYLLFATFQSLYSSIFKAVKTITRVNGLKIRIGYARRILGMPRWEPAILHMHRGIESKITPYVPPRIVLD